MPISISAEVYFAVCIFITADKSSRSYEWDMNEHKDIRIAIDGANDITGGSHVLPFRVWMSLVRIFTEIWRPRNFRDLIFFLFYLDSN